MIDLSLDIFVVICLSGSCAIIYPKGLVVCENWGSGRKSLACMVWFPPQVVCYGEDDVYYLVRPEDTDPDQIEAAVVERHQWQTNVCSSCEQVPEGDIPDEAFLDEIVANTKHIFIPAFDGGNYLIWTTQ